jgi:hypothetical protein
VLGSIAMVAVAGVVSFLALWKLGFVVDVLPLFLGVLLVGGTSLSWSWVQSRRQLERQEEALEALRAAGEDAADLILKASSTGMEADGLGAAGPYAASLSIPEVTPPTVLRSISTVLGAEYGFMWLCEDDGSGRWLSTAPAGDPGAERAMRVAKALVPLAASDGRACLVQDVRRDPRFRRFAGDVGSALGVRLALGERALATVVLCGKTPTPVSPTKQFEIPDVRVACAMAPQVALLLDHARLHRNVRSLLTRAVSTLTAAVHAKDAYTRGHSERVAFYAKFLARAMGLPARTLEVVELGALLHDVGKIGMDEVLLKGSRGLDEQEWALVKQHPGTGGDIIADMPELSFLLPALRHHHERWDGGGYPDGLKGTETPLLARLMAVADAFDAMTFERSYRDAPLSFDEACAELNQGAGSQFDPELATLFVEHASPDLITRAHQIGSSRTGTAARLGKAADVPAGVDTH